LFLFSYTHLDVPFASVSLPPPARGAADRFPPLFLLSGPCGWQHPLGKFTLHTAFCFSVRPILTDVGRTLLVLCGIPFAARPGTSPPQQAPSSRSSADDLILPPFQLVLDSPSHQLDSSSTSLAAAVAASTLLSGGAVCFVSLFSFGPFSFLPGKDPHVFLLMIPPFARSHF